MELARIDGSTPDDDPFSAQTRAHELQLLGEALLGERPVSRREYREIRSETYGKLLESSSGVSSGAQLARRRAERMWRARLRGTHSEGQWQRLCAEFGGLCVRCLHRPGEHKDHIIPVALGGSDGITNLQPLCSTCNWQKGDRNAIDWVAVRRAE